MSTPTAGERDLAARLGLDPAAVAAARQALNAIAALSWPWPERVSLLARLAREARADVGTVLGGLALRAAPLQGFDALIPLIGLAEKRVAGLVRALSGFDLSIVSREAAELQRARQAVAALRVENDALVAELDRLRVALGSTDGTPAPSPSSALPLADLAGSVGSQVVSADAALRAAPGGLRLAGLELRLQGAGAVLDDQVALDLAAPTGGSSVTLAFAPGGAPPAAGTSAVVPDVRGYGAALARRKLEAAGFGARLLSTGEGLGVVRDQVPAPGSPVLAGSDVRLVLG